MPTKQQQGPAACPAAPASAAQARNRRLQWARTQAAAARATQAGALPGYFSEREMKLRSPAEYEELVNRHVPPGERLRPFADDTTLVERVYESIDRQAYYERLEAVQRRHAVVEFEVEDEDEDAAVVPADADLGAIESESNLSPEERQELYSEFERIMIERFVDGEEDFDYSAVDNDSALDGAEYDRDLEEKWFDQDDSYENDHHQADYSQGDHQPYEEKEGVDYRMDSSANDDYY
jgi:hypothetical protein